MDVLERIFDVFSTTMEKIPDWLAELVKIFYTAPTTSGGTGSLTFLGVLAVAGLSISVCFLIMGVIQKFLHFRG